MGRRWYDHGKLLHKKNTFTDFVACARHLVDDRLDHPRADWSPRAAAPAACSWVRSPTRRRTLFGGIVAGVPFVDTLTTMLDASLPLTVTEYEEWGNPEDDAEVYDYIASYAPYDNVAAVDYPPILAETSFNDTRVLYVEPAKWIARLRATADGRRDFAAQDRDGGRSRRRLRAVQGLARPGLLLAWILDRMGLAGSPDSRRPDSWRESPEKSLRVRRGGQLTRPLTRRSG